MLLGRGGPAPGLAVAGDHAARKDVEDRIILERAHEVGRLHDLVGGVQAPGRPRVRQSYLQNQQAERISPLGPRQSHPFPEPSSARVPIVYNLAIGSEREGAAAPTRRRRGKAAASGRREARRDRICCACITPIALNAIAEGERITTWRLKTLEVLQFYTRYIIVRVCKNFILLRAMT